MDAVREVDLKLLARCACTSLTVGSPSAGPPAIPTGRDSDGTPGVRTYFNHFVHRRGTEALARIAVLFRATCRADVGVEHMQVRGLIFVMTNRGMIDVGHFVERELLVEAKILVARRRSVAVVAIRGQLLHRFMAGLLMISIEDAPGATAGDVLQSAIDHSQPATVTKACMEVSIPSQFRRNPTFFHACFKRLQPSGGEIVGQ